MAQDRSGVEEAYPGDVIGIHNHGTIKIGDTAGDKEPLSSLAFPTSRPNTSAACARSIRSRASSSKGTPSPGGRRRGAAFRPLRNNDYILGAVVCSSLKSRLRGLAMNTASKPPTNPSNTVRRAGSAAKTKKLEEFRSKAASNLAVDIDGNLTYLAETTGV